MPIPRGMTSSKRRRTTRITASLRPTARGYHRTMVELAERRSDMAARETSLLCCRWDLLRDGLSTLQARKCDLDEPADRSLGWQVAGGTEGMHAIGGEFVNRNIVAEVAGIRDIG